LETRGRGGGGIRAGRPAAGRLPDAGDGQAGLLAGGDGRAAGRLAVGEDVGPPLLDRLAVAVGQRAEAPRLERLAALLQPRLVRQVAGPPALLDRLPPRPQVLL